MLKDMIKTVAESTGLTQVNAKAAIGIVLNTSERQGSPLAEAIFQKMPGARTLSATAGSKTEAPADVIACLIEKTPGGRRFVAERMFNSLHKIGLGHREVAKLLPSIGQYMRTTYRLEDFAHLGDFIAADAFGTALKKAAAA